MKKTLLRLLLPLMLAVLMLPALPFSAVAEAPLTVTVFVGEPRDQPTSDNKAINKTVLRIGRVLLFKIVPG